MLFRSCASEFLLQFGGAGYMAVPMPTSGTHVLFLALFGIGVVVGIRMLSSPQTSNLRLPAVVVCGGGIYGLLSFGYYANRSYASNLVPYILVASVVSIGLFQIWRQHVEFGDRLHRYLCILLLAVPTMTLSRLPDFGNEAQRLFAPDAAVDFAQRSRWAGMREYIVNYSIMNSRAPDEIAIISENTVTDSVVAGVRPGLPYNSPKSIVLKSQLARSCRHLQQSQVQVVFVNSLVMSPAVTAILTCAGFRLTGSASDVNIFLRSEQS